MLEIIRDTRRLEEVTESWRALAAFNPVPMLSHEWTIAAAEAFASRAELAVFAIWEGEQLRAAAPLGLFREGFSRRLHLIHYPLREPGALLFRDEKALADLSEAIGKENHALSLARLHAGSLEERAMRENRRGSLTLFADTGSTHAAVLPSTEKALEASMSSSARTTLRRKLRRAEKYGTVRFVVERPDAQQCADMVEDLVRIEGSGWKRRNGTALVCLPEQRAFFDAYSKRVAETGGLRVYRMLIDGRTVAIRIGLVSERRLYELKIGFDEAFRDCSPGLLLTHETLKAAIAEGLERHEFLGMAEDWQRHWPLEVRNHVSVRRYPLATTGTLILGQDIYDRVRGRLLSLARR
ncbi:GNAT family N-acetyltransferase [Rhizobium sp. LjRoot30]|uniref:GNAT family N-acetyltransferase n=1 Tax=Rhizobium sp. LjRoot30 TaxID=3342320 RepID=UPI003ECD8E4B